MNEKQQRLYADIKERHSAGTGEEPHTIEAVDMWMLCGEVHDDRRELIAMIDNFPLDLMNLENGIESLKIKWRKRGKSLTTWDEVLEELEDLFHFLDSS